MYMLLGSITESPKVMGASIVLLTAFGAPLTYSIVQRFCESAQAAMIAATVWSAVPGIIPFAPILNVVTPVILLFGLWLLLALMNAPKPFGGILLECSLVQSPG